MKLIPQSSRAAWGWVYPTGRWRGRWPGRQLGVVSGTALDQVFARRQDGDRGGRCLRRALSFPFRKRPSASGTSTSSPMGSPQAPATPHAQLRRSGRAPRTVHRGQLRRGDAGARGPREPGGQRITWRRSRSTCRRWNGALLARAGYVLMGAGIPSGHLRRPGLPDARPAAVYAVRRGRSGKGRGSRLPTFTPLYRPLARPPPLDAAQTSSPSSLPTPWPRPC